MSYDIGRKLGDDRNSFGNKNHASNDFGKKNHLRTIHNGINTFSEYAMPTLGVISALNPELIPITGPIGAGIMAAQEFSRLGANFVDDIHKVHRQHRPQLQK